MKNCARIGTGMQTMDRNVLERCKVRSGTGYAPSNNSLPDQSSKQNMEVVSQTGHKNKESDQFEEVVSSAELIAKICHGCSRTLAKEGLRFFQIASLGNDDGCRHLFALQSWKEVVD